MTDIVSATGTYSWYYSYHAIPHGGTVGIVDASSKSEMNLSAGISFTGAGFPVPLNNITDNLSLQQLMDAVGISRVFEGKGPTVVTSVVQDGTTWNSNTATYVGATLLGLVSTGVTYDTGTVQIYGVAFAEQTSNYFSPTQITVSTYTTQLWFYYAPTSASPIPPAPDAYPTVPVPPPVTIQLGRSGPGVWVPKAGQGSILPKYANGVAGIRAKFNGTHIAVVMENNLGGIMIYEEVAGSPSGSVYVYNADRTLNTIIDASQIFQYT